jgi:hypothetical protein
MNLGREDEVCRFHETVNYSLSGDDGVSLFLAAMSGPDQHAQATESRRWHEVGGSVANPDTLTKFEPEPIRGCEVVRGAWLPASAGPRHRFVVRTDVGGV